MQETDNNESSPNQAPVLNVKSTRTPMPHSQRGPILAALIIILVFIFGGLYLWGGMLSNTGNFPVEDVIINDEPETPRAVADTKILETLSPSDELDAIESDITSTNLDSIDTDLTAIDVEFDSALPQ